MRYWKECVFGLCCLTAGANAKSLEVNQNNARLTFAGEHAGRAFIGKFTQWQSKLVLPPASVPSITAEFILASANTGNGMYDETLVEADWFDIDNTPKGRFVSSQITPSYSGYRVEGELTLRGKSIPIAFELKKQGSRLTASFTIDRLAYDIGRESDPEAEWVSRDISMALTIEQ